MGTTYAAIQNATRAFAENLGDRWTRDDLEFVVAFTDTERDEDLAFALGRSLASIQSIQHRIRTEGVEGVFESMRRRTPRVGDAGYDYVTTFPPGHFD